MPAFTFEKISPPQRPGVPSSSSPSSSRPQQISAAQSRGTVIQVLGRFVEARVQRSQHDDAPQVRRPLPK